MEKIKKTFVKLWVPEWLKEEAEKVAADNNLTVTSLVIRGLHREISDLKESTSQI